MACRGWRGRSGFAEPDGRTLRVRGHAAPGRGQPGGSMRNAGTLTLIAIVALLPRGRGPIARPVALRGQRAFGIARADRLLILATDEGEPKRNVSNIRSMKLDGTGIVNLTHSSLMEFEPVWSPDGK